MPDKKQNSRKLFREPPSQSESDDTQIAKFREAARELDTDDSEERFDKIVKRIAKAPEPKDTKKGQHD